MNLINLISSYMRIPHRKVSASHIDSEAGFILIAALAMLVTLVGVVLVCIYPLVYEASQAPRHRETLRRLKTAERGIFGRLADQPGGDTGSKMLVEKLVENNTTYSTTRLNRIMAFWYHRRFSSIPVLNEKGKTEINEKEEGRNKTVINEGCNDIYRYDPDKGFWVGYRGKRYLARPAGEEHLRESTDAGTHGTTEFKAPRFYTGGSDFFLELAGMADKSTFFLKMLNTGFDFENQSPYGSELDKNIEHTRYFNPVEKLIVRVNDRRDKKTTLSAVLVYAKQPDPENANEIAHYFPQLPSRVVTESRAGNSQENTTEFTFVWEPTNTIDDDKEGYIPIVDVGHTFEIGFKKLILKEGDIPVFACGITIPPVRDCQCVEKDDRTVHHNGCVQPYFDQYVVEIDYDG